MPSSGIRHDLGVHIGDPGGNRYRFGAGVHSQKVGERTSVRPVPTDLFLQAFHQTKLAQAGRHDIGHNLRPTHGFDDGAWDVAEAQHPVPTIVMDHRTFCGDDPWTSGRQGYVGIHCIPSIEVHQPGLDGFHLSQFIQAHEVGKFRPQSLEVYGRVFNSLSQFRMGIGEAFDGLVGEALSSGLSPRGPDGFELFYNTHDHDTHLEHLKVRSNRLTTHRKNLPEPSGTEVREQA